MSALRYGVIALAIFAGGCASLAKRPPSPAQNITPQEMLAKPTPPNERYYIMVFGSQSFPRVPRYVHSWATVVKVTDQPDGCPPLIEQHTISWMPATLKIRPWNFRVEPGANLDLHVTIEEMLKNNERVAMWGRTKCGTAYDRSSCKKPSWIRAVAYQ